MNRIVSLDLDGLNHTEFIKEATIVDEAGLMEQELWPEIFTGKGQPNQKPGTRLRTQDVVESLMKYKKHKGVKESTLHTYRKRYAQFEREFPWLPEELDPVLNYLGHFSGETGRHRRNHHDLLNVLYKHAVRYFGLFNNPLDGLERPLVDGKPIITLSLEQVQTLDTTPETSTERVALDMLLGHGWRQVEVRRILAKDVVGIRRGMIWCRGKERNEWTPVLPETEERLKSLAREFGPEDHVLRSKRIRRGRTASLGEDGMAQLVGRLYARADITEMTGHDLRRTFATLVAEAAGDEALAMRLLRDRVPELHNRYIDTSEDRLIRALKAYSPLRQIRQKETSSTLCAEPAVILGGDGGESNSPSRRSDPEYTTGIVGSLISSG